MQKKFSSIEEVENKKERLEKLRLFFNLHTEQDVIVLALRVLEHAMTEDSGIFTVDSFGDAYEIEIG